MGSCDRAAEGHRATSTSRRSWTTWWSGNASAHRGQHDAGLQAGERGAEAVVDAVAERQRAVARAVEVELVRGGRTAPGRGWRRRWRGASSGPASPLTPPSSKSSVAMRSVFWTGLSKRRSSSTAARRDRRVVGQAARAGRAGSTSATTALPSRPLTWSRGRRSSAGRSSTAARAGSAGRRPRRPRPGCSCDSRSSPGSAVRRSIQPSSATFISRMRGAHLRRDEGVDRVDDLGELVGPGLQPGPVLLGDAEQLADHVDRQRGEDRLEQVDGAVVADLADQLVGDLRDPRLDALDGPRRERPGHEPAQPGVVGRVDAGASTGERGPVLCA